MMVSLLTTASGSGVAVWVAVGRGVAVGGIGVLVGARVAVGGGAGWVAVADGVMMGAGGGTAVGLPVEDRQAREVSAATSSTIRMVTLRGMDWSFERER